MWHDDAMSCDVIVIGAGAFGSSLTFHLATKGKRVTLLDRFAVGSQTSPRAAGLFKQIQSTATRTRLAMLSVQKLLNFETETGFSSPAVCSGSLMVARTDAHADYVTHAASQAHNWGADVEVADAAEAHRLMPMLRAEGLLAVAHTPGDIYIEEPVKLLDAYLDAAARLGATVLPHTYVKGIRIQGGQVQGVLTDRGAFEAPVVVDAAGPWARAVGAAAGAQLPVVPVRHQLYITAPVAGVEARYPILRFVDSAVYIRPARGGLMLGGFEADPLPFEIRGRENFSMEQTPLDFSVLARQTTSVEDSVPALRDTTIREHRGGLFTMTADGNFLAGPVADIHGLWSLTGCNGSGFSFSPALGQVMAEWIADGEPSIDLSEFSPSRASSQMLDERQLTSACVWQYAHYYDPTREGRIASAHS
jgi:glycine/D-amino acid oxidase-like deaminating enzyme